MNKDLALSNLYQEQALQTKAPTEGRYNDAQYAGYGMMTEVGELLDTYKRHKYYKVPLDKKNLIEEVGDILWYIALGYDSLGMQMADTAPVLMEIKQQVDLDFLLAKLVRNASNFFTITMTNPSSWTDNYLQVDLENLYGYLAIYTEQELGISVEEAAKMNIEKLAKRYPEKTFSFERAVKRDTVNELNHIEVKENGH